MFFAGKGGVGKTTSAAAHAVARSAAGDRVLIVSTDPAHSLGDALGVRLSSVTKRVRRSLDAVELDAPRPEPAGEVLEVEAVGTPCRVAQPG